MYGKYTELLKERGVSTKSVCDTMDIPESTMSMWKLRWLKWKETGEGKEPTPSFETVVKLAKYFEKPIEYFIG